MIKRTLTHGVETVFIEDKFVGDYRIREVMGGFNIQHTKSKKWLPLHYTSQKDAVVACKRGMETGKCKPVVSRFETAAPLKTTKSAYRKSKDETIRARQEIVKAWQPPKSFLATHLAVVCVGEGNAETIKEKIISGL